MPVNKEEVLHIADLADLNIKEEEVQDYQKNLQEILGFMDILKNVDTDNVKEAIGTTRSINVFRKDEIKEFEDKESLLENAPDKESNMFKIPKVI